MDDEEHVRMIELLLGGEFISAAGLGTTFIEERHPVAQEGGVVMRAGAVRLGTGADEDPERLRR